MFEIQRHQKNYTWDLVSAKALKDVSKDLQSNMDNIIQALIDEKKGITAKLTKKLLQGIALRVIDKFSLSSTERKSILIFLKTFEDELQQEDNKDYIQSFYFHTICCNDKKLSKKLLKNIIVQDNWGDLKDSLRKEDPRSSKEKLVLYEASIDNIEALKQLIKEGVSIDKQDAITGISPLMIACVIQNEPMVHLLVENGASVNAINFQHKTALMLASEGGSLKLVHYLLENGAKAKAYTLRGNTALHLAAESGHLEIINLLIRHDASLEAKYEGLTPLFSAYKNRQLDAVKLLLNLGADINALDDEGHTLLTRACLDQEVALINFLVQKEADLNAGPFSPLHFAALNGLNDLVSLLLAHPKIEINAKDSFGEAALHLALGNQFYKTADLLIEHQADVNIQNNSGTTPLILAAYDGFYTRVRYLIKKGAKVNICDYEGLSPLMVACFNDDAEVVAYLLKKGAEVNHASPKTADTALTLACKKPSFNVIPLLLKYRADVNVSVRSDDYYTPLIYLLSSQSNRSDREAMSLKLIDLGADVHCPKTRSTPLQRAATLGFLKTAEKLLEKGANPNETGQENDSPIIRALWKGNVLLLNLLLRYTDAPDPISIENALYQGMLSKHSNLKMFDSYFHLIKKPLIQFLEKFNLRISFLEIQTLSQLEEKLSSIISEIVKCKQPLDLPAIIGSQKLLKAMKQLMSEAEYLTDIYEEPNFLDFVFKINPIHFSKVSWKKANSETDAQQTDSIEILEKLNTMFAEINFHDPKKIGYKNPALLKDQGQPTSISDMQRGFATFFNRAKLNQEFLKLAVEIARGLETLSVDEKATYLIDLAISGNHCANTLAELYRIHNLLYGSLPESFEEKILKELLLAREGIISNWAISEGGTLFQTHRYTHYMYLLGKELNLPNAEKALFEKPDENSGICLTPEEVRAKFYAQYHFGFLYDFIKDSLWSFYKMDQEEVIDWFKDNVPSYWKKEYYEELIASTKDLTREEVQKLFVEKGIWLDPLILTAKDAILKYRELDYLQELFNFDDNLEPIEFTRSAIINVLLTLEIFSLMEPN